jgi:hypothetical protein
VAAFIPAATCVGDNLPRYESSFFFTKAPEEGV